MFGIVKLDATVQTRQNIQNQILLQPSKSCVKVLQKNKPKEHLFKTLHRLEDNLQLGMI